jgi:glycosyltransferase involved in cell wall biosynthesis
MVSYISNGVDQCFVGENFTNQNKTTRKHVLYAGNLGEGQGIEKIIPALAKATQNHCDFTIIGSGGKLQALQAACESINNISLLAPIARDALIEKYKQADVLFLHLNDYPAFKRVLPSKLFEYAITKKPILAGIPGFSAQFVQDNIPGAWLFDPCDVSQGIKQLQEIINNAEIQYNRDTFCQRFDRKKLMEKLADIIIQTI